MYSNHAAPYTYFDSVKAYMRANNIQSVTNKMMVVYCAQEINWFGNQRAFSAGEVVEATFTSDDFGAVQSIWGAMEYYLIVDFGI